MSNGPGERRVLERHAEMAPQHEHAASLGHGPGLGPVVGLFVRETQGPAKTALGMLLIGLVLSVCVSAGASLVGYRLRTYDGRVVRLPIAFNNANDPYAPVGGILRALSRGIDEVLPQFPTRWQNRWTLLPFGLSPTAPWTASRPGNRWSSAKVTVDPYGITYAKKPALLWGEVTGWKLDDGQLKLERAPGRPKRLVIPMTHVEGGWILIRLLAERAPATEN